MLRNGELYLAEADRQLQDNSTCENNSFKDAHLVKLVEKSSSIFQSHEKGKHFTEEELKYFTYRCKKVTNVGKMYLFPKICKHFVNVPDCPVILNCGTPTEKASKFLGDYIQPIFRLCMSFITDNNDLT